MRGKREENKFPSCSEMELCILFLCRHPVIVQLSATASQETPFHVCVPSSLISPPPFFLVPTSIYSFILSLPPPHFPSHIPLEKQDEYSERNTTVFIWVFRSENGAHKYKYCHDIRTHEFESTLNQYDLNILG